MEKEEAKARVFTKIKDGDKMMKKLVLKYGSVLAALAMIVTSVGVNTACTWVGYQPKLPKNAEKLRKF